MTKRVEWDRTQVNRVFWGMLLIILHLKVGEVDLLPDFVGYFLYYMAIDGLTVDVPEERSLKWLAALFAVQELADQLMVVAGISLSGTVAVVYSLVSGLLHVWFEYKLFTLLIDTAAHYNCVLRRDSLSRIRAVQVVCGFAVTAMTALTPMAQNVQWLLGSLAMLLLAVGLVAFAVTVWACVVIRGLWKDMVLYADGGIVRE